MSKFYGAIGYSVTEEIRPGVWGEKITVRDYYGDVIRNTRQYQSFLGVILGISTSQYNKTADKEK